MLYQGKEYDVTIEDGDIILTEMMDPEPAPIIFKGAGAELTEQAESIWWHIPFAGERLSSFVSRYIEDNLLNYLWTLSPNES